MDTTPLQLAAAVYVLKCHGPTPDQPRFYIGQTMSLNRLAQHWSRRGSTFTKTYKPMSVDNFIYGAGPTTERDETLRYIRMYGFNFPDGSPRVRGAGWCGLNCKPPCQQVLEESASGANQET